MCKHGIAACVVSVLCAGGAWAADAPVAATPAPATLTFEKLDRELTFYKGRAGLEGETNAQCEANGIAYYALFDLFLKVMNDPEHPRHKATKKVWDDNQAKFREQAPMVAMMLGNAIPLLISADEGYARGFAEGAKQHAPNFSPEDYVQPMSTVVGEGDKARKVAWYHGLADADGDGVSNEEELLAIAPNWRPVKDGAGVKKEGTGLGVTPDDREKFLEAALDKAPANEAQ